MGVVNVTPDSFSDGGVHIQPAAAAAAGWRMLAEGAAIVDVGGESTRPGSAGVPVEEELRRVVPVLESLHGAPISIDTAKAEVARRALELDAELVNDVTALRGDPQHGRGGRRVRCLRLPDAHAGRAAHDAAEPDATTTSRPRSPPSSRSASRFAVAAGIPEDRIALDPGIGFGKTVQQNFELVRRLDVLTALGRPVVVGFSRKSSLGRIVGDATATTGSLAASIAAAVAAYERGATILRVHDVREHVEALTVATAVAG